jgi:hypothetical protein
VTKKEHAELLELVAELAPKLRGAGVIEVGLPGGFFAKLAPAIEAEPPDDKGGDADEAESNPWTDPATFGRTKGVPGKDPRKEPGR